MKLTPMLEQYLRIKQDHPDALLFFRLGDFYELFFEDAERAARLLEITLTTRSKKDEVPIPMCGVPFHAVQSYVARLLNSGYKVALCDQMEDPATAKGIVTRAVVRVMTPGTVTEEEFLDPKRPNYLAAVYSDESGSAVVCADLSTGEVQRFGCAEDGEVLEALTRMAPREILVPEGAARLASAIERALPGVLVNLLPATRFDGAAGAAWLRPLRSDESVARASRLAACAMAALRWYLEHTHRASLAHLQPPQEGEQEGALMIDEASRRNLELVATTRGERRGSLLWVLDETHTPMGARLLRRWLLAPLTDPERIGERLDAVEGLLRAPALREELSTILSKIGDLERLNGRLTAKRVTPRDLVGLATALAAVQGTHETLSQAHTGLLERCRSGLDDLPQLRARITATLSDDPPLNVRAGGVIRAGFDARIDELRDLARSGKRTISDLETAERARTGINSLKVRYNQVFGYYIEVTKPNLHLVPPDYGRKQTLANAERFVTPQLEEYERKILGAEERLTALEAQLFDDLVDGAAVEHASLSRTASALAVLDVLVALATVAERRGYCRPQLHRGRRMVIEGGRHPVVELMVGRQGFVPNDCVLDPENEQILILTGPNMAGKSTYLRQIALITLLAQMGSFVPASRADIGIHDRVFTRIGASDNLSAGESTFMVEMKETSNILRQLTERSLVVLDEIGRGTSTFDGISIAWAVAEFLHDSPARPLVLFATHYHELTDLARTKERVRNYSVAVKEWKGEVLFLRRIVSGPASQSYGIQVAQLAGVPDPIIGRAKEILGNLERGELTESGLPRLAQPAHGKENGQLALFAPDEERLRRQLALTDVERLTPIEALNRLSELVEMARKAEQR
jgi:DNA mismatch repair protein MutS